MFAGPMMAQSAQPANLRLSDYKKNGGNASGWVSWYLTLLRARALENHLYIVSSGFDVESSIIDPKGEVLFATMDSGVTKTISVNLADRSMDSWLGDMRARFHKEIRTDIAAPHSAATGQGK
jgi:hypothetical protein